MKTLIIAAAALALATPAFAQLAPSPPEPKTDVIDQQWKQREQQLRASCQDARTLLFENRRLQNNIVPGTPDSDTKLLALKTNEIWLRDMVLDCDRRGF